MKASVLAILAITYINIKIRFWLGLCTHTCSRCSSPPGHPSVCVQDKPFLSSKSPERHSDPLPIKHTCYLSWEKHLFPLYGKCICLYCRKHEDKLFYQFICNLVDDVRVVETSSVILPPALDVDARLLFKIWQMEVIAEKKQNAQCLTAKLIDSIISFWGKKIPLTTLTVSLN